MTTATKTSDRARLEARIDHDLDQLIVEAADKLHVTKTAFVIEVMREAAMKVIARSDVTLMDSAEFDRMMGALEIPDESPELKALVAQPRLIEW